MRKVMIGLLALSFALALVAPSAGAALATRCVASCPCEDAHDERDADHRDADPGEEACSDDCSRCGCCAALVVLLGPQGLDADEPSETRAEAIVSLVSVPAGTRSNVFRPPRLVA